MHTMRASPPSPIPCPHSTRKVAMELLADGFTDRCLDLFRIAADETRARSLPTVQNLISKAERAAPKPTAKDPLYGEFGSGSKKKKVAEADVIRLIG